jgi:HlyD family secretion protein
MPYPFPRYRATALRGAFIATVLLSGCGTQDSPTLQGYAEAEYVRVAAPYAGALNVLAVRRGNAVKSGAPLFVLEQESEAAARREAAEQLKRAQAQLANLTKGKRPQELEIIRAQQAQAQAALKLSTVQLERNERLFKSGAITREKLDEARTTRDLNHARVEELAAQQTTARLAARHDEIAAAAAQVEAARATLSQADWRLGQKSVTAPVDALVEDTLYAQGEWVPAGNPVVSLLPPQNIKVRFFVPEPLLGALHIGQQASVSCDGCAAPIVVTVSFIAHQPEYTPPVIYSRESRSKLVFLVEARPSAQDAVKLHPGQPLDVSLK